MKEKRVREEKNVKRQTFEHHTVGNLASSYFDEF